MPGGLPREPLPALTWQVLSQLPDIATVAAVSLFGIHWITSRRAAVRRGEGPDAPVEPPSGARRDERPGP
jgi:hypothetical protein